MFLTLVLLPQKYKKLNIATIPFDTQLWLVSITLITTVYLRFAEERPAV